MRVSGPKGATYRCDSCAVLARDGDEFLKFSVAKFDIGKRRVVAGIAAASNPKVPAILHSCSSCKSKITLACKLNDPSKLPPGPLREYFEHARSKDILQSLRLL